MSSSTATTYSEWQKRPVPTFRPGGKGSLQEVIDKSPPYSRIMVIGGVYNEQLVITKPIELIGEEGEEPIISHKGPVVSIHNDVECFIQRVGFQSKVTSKNNTKEAPAVLLGGHCKPVFKSCEISSVMVTTNADPQFILCTIGKNANGPCISVRDHASGTYLQNKFRETSSYCIEVCSRGSPRFIDNTIEADSKDPSMAGNGLLHVYGGKDVCPVFQANRFEDLVDANAVARYVNTVMYSSRRTAVVVDGFAEPVFEDNMFIGSELCITLRACGGLFRNNTVTSSRSCGIYVRSGCSMRISENKVQGNATYGIVLDGCDCAQLDGNHVSNNAHCGCLIVHSSNFTLANNHFVSNAGGGLCVWENARGLIKENDFRMNQRYGVYFYGTECLVTFRQNRLLSNSPSGIICENGCAPEIIENDVTASSVTGLWITTSANPIVTKNTIADCERYGVIVTANGRGQFLKNSLRGGRDATLFVTDGANPVVTENDIGEGGVSCVMVSEGGIGVFSQNKIRSSAFGVTVRLFADPLFVGNYISQCGEGGIVSEEEGVGTFSENVIEKCGNGFVCDRGGEAVFRGNLVKECGAAGAALKSGSRALLEKNKFDANAIGITIHGEDARPYIRQNQISNSTTYGIVSFEKGAGEVYQNHILTSGTAALASLSDGQTFFHKNRCSHDRGHGILCRHGGVSKFEDNSLEYSSGSGVLVDQGGKPEITKCIFAGCKGYGIEIAHGAEGTIDNCQVTNCEIGFKGHGSCKCLVTNVKFDANKEFGGILVENAEATLRKCTFSNHPKIALAVRNSAKSLLDQCLFIDNNIDVESTVLGSLTTLQKCRLSGDKCKIHVDYHANGDVRLDDCVICDGEVGVRFHDRGQGHIQDTHFSKLTKQAIVFESACQGSVTSCFVTDCEIGCESNADARGHVSDTIFDGNGGNIIVTEKSLTEFLRCEIKRATRRPGVDCAKSLGSFANCRIIENEMGGVRSHGPRTKTSFTECSITDNGNYGVEGSEKSESPFVNCTIEHNKGPGVIFAYQSLLQFTEKNTIRGNGFFGIVCEDGSDGIFSNGLITSHLASANIKLDPGSQTRFERNTITNAKFGIVAEGSNSTLFMNTIKEHKFCAIQVFGKSAATFDSNEIHDNTGAVMFGQEFDVDFYLGNNNNTVITSTVSDVTMLSSTTNGGEDVSPTELARRRKLIADARLSQQGLSTAAGGLVTRSSQNRRGTLLTSPALPVGGIITLENNSSDLASGINNGSFVRQVSFANLPPSVMAGGGLVSPNNNNNNNRNVASSTPLERRNSGGLSLSGVVTEQTALAESTYVSMIMNEPRRSSNPYERKRPSDAARVNNSQPTCAIFRNNTFYNNGTDGAVKISQWASPIFIQNTFRNEKKAVVILDDGRGNIEQNEFSNNDVAVSITGPTCTCVVALNKFLKNRIAIEMNKLSATATHKNNTNPKIFLLGENICEDSTEAAIICGNNCECAIESFEFKGGNCGIKIRDRSCVAVSDCTFSAIEDSGIVVDTLASPTITKCRFDSGCRVGLRLLDCAAKVELCVFVACALAGLVMEHSGCQSKVTKCLFTQNCATPESVGVLLRNRTQGEITLCDFHENSYGIRAEDSGEGVVSQCLIHRQVNGGILCTTNSSPKFRKCSFAQNTSVDILSQSGARPEIQRCLFRGDALHAVKASAGGCILTDCAFRGYTEAAIHFNVGTGASVSRSYFTACDCAVLSSGKSTTGHGCDFVSNLVEGCRVGAKIHLGSGVSVSNNIFRNCDALGIELRHLGAGCTVSNNYITKCGDRGIRVFDLQAQTVEGTTTVSHNIISDFSTGYGVDIGGGVSCTFIFQENIIFGNCRFGLNCADGEPRVVRNQISNCDSGMTIQKNCGGFFEGNVTHSCGRVGTLIYSSTADVQKNFFCSTGEAGALEVKNDSSGNSGSRQSGNVKANDIKNNYVPHWAKIPDVPIPDFVTVNDVKLSKEEQQPMTVLRGMYQEDQLPAGPECLCDLVAPIAPTARDVHRVNMLSRPKGQAKSASERAADALAGIQAKMGISTLNASNYNTVNSDTSDAGSGPSSPAPGRRQSISGASPTSKSIMSSSSKNVKNVVRKVQTVARLTAPRKSTFGEGNNNNSDLPPASPSASLRKSTTTTIPPKNANNPSASFRLHNNGNRNASPPKPSSTNLKNNNNNNKDGKKPTNNNNTSSAQQSNQNTTDAPKSSVSMYENNNGNDDVDDGDEEENNNNQNETSETDQNRATMELSDVRVENSQYAAFENGNKDADNDEEQEEIILPSQQQEDHHQEATLNTFKMNAHDTPVQEVQSSSSRQGDDDGESRLENNSNSNNNDMQEKINNKMTSRPNTRESITSATSSSRQTRGDGVLSVDSSASSPGRRNNYEFVLNHDANVATKSVIAQEMLMMEDNVEPDDEEGHQQQHQENEDEFDNEEQPEEDDNTENELQPVGNHHDDDENTNKPYVLGNLLTNYSSQHNANTTNNNNDQQQQQRSHLMALQTMQLSSVSGARDTFIKQKLRENSSGVGIKQSQQFLMLQRFGGAGAVPNQNQNNNTAPIPDFYTGDKAKELTDADKKKLQITLTFQQQQEQLAKNKNKCNNNNNNNNNQVAVVGTINQNTEDLLRHRNGGREVEKLHPIEEEDDVAQYESNPRKNIHSHSIDDNDGSKIGVLANEKRRQGNSIASSWNRHNNNNYEDGKFDDENAQDQHREEIPVKYAFKVTSLSYENGQQEMTDGVPIRSIKGGREYVSPSAVDNFATKSKSKNQDVSQENNDDPDLENNNHNATINNGDDDENVVVEGLYNYQSGNKSVIAPSPPIARTTRLVSEIVREHVDNDNHNLTDEQRQQKYDEHVRAQSARNSYNRDRLHSPTKYFDKSARLREKVSGYQKQMGVSFFHSSGGMMSTKMRNLKSSKNPQDVDDDGDDGDDEIKNNVKVARAVGGPIITIQQKDNSDQNVNTGSSRHWSSATTLSGKRKKSGGGSPPPTPNSKKNVNSELNNNNNDKTILSPDRRKEQEQQNPKGKIQAELERKRQLQDQEHQLIRLDENNQNQPRTGFHLWNNNNNNHAITPLALKHPSPLKRNNNHNNGEGDEYDSCRVLTKAIRKAQQKSVENQQQNEESISEKIIIEGEKQQQKQETQSESTPEKKKKKNSKSKNNNSNNEDVNKSDVAVDAEVNDEEADERAWKLHLQRQQEQRNNHNNNQNYAINSEFYLNNLLNQQQNLSSSASSSSPQKLNNKINNEISWNQQLSKLKISGRSNNVNNNNNNQHQQQETDGNNNTTLPLIVPSPPRNNKTQNNNNNHQLVPFAENNSSFTSSPPPISTYLTKKQQEKIKNNNADSNESSSNNITVMSPKHVAAEAAKLQKNSRDVRRSDLFHSTTAQMFAAFDRKAGALGKMM